MSDLTSVLAQLSSMYNDINELKAKNIAQDKQILELQEEIKLLKLHKDVSSVTTNITKDLLKDVANTGGQQPKDNTVPVTKPDKPRSIRFDPPRKKFLNEHIAQFNAEANGTGIPHVNNADEIESRYKDKNNGEMKIKIGNIIEKLEADLKDKKAKPKKAGKKETPDKTVDENTINNINNQPTHPKDLTNSSNSTIPTFGTD